MSQPDHPAAATIADHDLLERIGRGGYGEVWIARNRLTHAWRAVKLVFRHEFEDERPYQREFEGVLRFEPISRSHPSQLAILHVGRDEAADCFYYVMELADPAGTGKREGRGGNGETAPQPPATLDHRLHAAGAYQPRTLRSELKSRGRLPVAEVLELGRALATALAHLHAHGLVHRDIKPSNVIYVGGVPKLADIGLVTDASDACSIVGTEGYIPPEGPGSPAADVFSLGKLLYEAATGRDRRDYPSLPDDLREWPDARRLTELNAVLLKACANDPRERYRSADQLRLDLERLQGGGSVRRRHTWERAGRQARRFGPVAALAALALLVLPRLLRQPVRPTGSPPAEKASVFVLPFRYDDTNKVADDLSARITDAFIDSLATLDGVRPSPRRSGWVHADEEELRRSLTRTNDMRHILSGRLGGGGDTLTLSLQLHARGQTRPVWSEVFTGSTREVVAFERQALARLASSLGLKVGEEDQRQIDGVLERNREALRWLREAQAAYEKKAGTPAGYTEVQMLAQKALDVDPHYLDAEVTMVFILRVLSQERPPVEVWPAVHRGMRHVVEVDPTQAGALDQLWGHALFYNRDWTAALDFFSRELQAQAPRVRPWLRACVYRSFGWFEEARAAQQASETPEPTGADQRFHMAASRWVERRFDEGIAVARRSLELSPGHAEGYFWLAHCLVANGEFEAGLEAIQKAQEVWKKQEMTALRGYARARMGQPEKAREVLRELMDLRRTGAYLQPYFVARVYAALGERTEALDWLEKADADRSEYLVFADYGGLRTDPAWDGLQDEPRYWKLCERLGLGRSQWPRPRPPTLP